MDEIVECNVIAYEYDNDYDGHWEKGSPVVLCGALDLGQSLAQCAPLQAGHCVVGVKDH